MRFKSIKSLIATYVGLFFFLAVGIILFIASSKLHEEVLLKAEKEAGERTEDIASDIRAKLEHSLAISETFARTLATTKLNSEENLKLTRKDVFSIQKSLLSSNKDLFAIYTSWEPNAFDGKDKEYAGKLGFDKTGKFTSYWYYDNNQVAYEFNDPDVDKYSNEGDEDYYGRPRDARKSVIIDPYSYDLNGKQVLMITLASPIMPNGKFCGISNIDYEIDFIQGVCNNFNAYGNEAQLAVFSQNGTIAGLSNQEDAIGKPIDLLFTDIADGSALKSLTRKGAHLDYFKDHLRIIQPFAIGKDGINTWYVSIIVPRKVITAEAYTIMYQLITIGLVLIAISLLVVLFFAKRIAAPIIFMAEGAKKVAEGDSKLEGLDSNIQAKIANRNDELGKIGMALNSIVDYFRKQATVADQISNGDFSGEVFIASDRDELGHSMEKMKNSIQAVIGEIDSTQTKQLTGDYEARSNAEGFAGAYADLINGFNQSLEFQVGNLSKVLQIVDAYGKGDLDKELEEFPGKLKEANDYVNQVRNHLRNLAAEIVGLSEAAINGNIKKRGNADQFQGEYSRMVEGINETLDAMIAPTQEATDILQKMAEGNLNVRMTGDYKGDHAIIKNALNATLESLNEILQQTSMAVEQVATGSHQVSQASQDLSQGATEQASSLEEISASMVEIGSQTKLNADNAAQANKLANNTSHFANTGNEKMHEMLQSMEEINSASIEVQKIIKAIDEIAFQTNLLALNAAVEAARAGVHGKGFAVVAEEVRNLAQRSAKAANETTELIEGSVEKTKHGSGIAEETAKSLGEIVSEITKVTDLIGEIDSASREQSGSIDQITEALGQVDQVTQSNTASAEESAATSEELSGQADNLREMLSRFELTASHNGQNNAQIRKQTKRIASSQSQSSPRIPSTIGETHPEDIISLDDDDFGIF